MKPVIYLTRKERFNAAHKLWVNAWSEEKNMRTFGKCANKNWHGHNYWLYVTIKGHPDPLTGMVMDVKDLSALINRVIIDKVDHTNLNMDVDFIPENIQPTTENLTILFWKELAPHLAPGALHRIQLWETENIYVEYFGDQQ
ncbi:MAG: 6-carboxytetrahydropterin synthase [Saprospiraceae bacterium]|nr:6-carboxytetrahydropterin synthase [Saprospiraceae bacterium]